MLLKALVVIDVQNGLVELGDYTQELDRIEQLIRDFQEKNEPVIFMRHVDDEEESVLYKHSRGSEIHSSVKHYADHIIEKQTPSSFYNTNLAEELQARSVDHLYVVGFNTEFCCLFTSIAAFDRGYEVTMIEDATGTVNNAETYEMPGLDIRDFVGTVLHWSNVIEVLDYEEYVEAKNSSEHA